MYCAWRECELTLIVIKGIQYYYSGSTYKNVLDRFWYEMKRSAALTLAYTFKKKTAAWSFSKFSSELTVVSPKNGNKIKLLMPVVGEHIFKNRQLNYMLVTPKDISLLTNQNVICFIKKLNCVIPNCTFAAKKWHYIKHKKNFKGNSLQKFISVYSVKQIPLCLGHYNLIYFGKYDGPSLQKLPSYTSKDFS